MVLFPFSICMFSCRIVFPNREKWLDTPLNARYFLFLRSCCFSSLCFNPLSCMFWLPSALSSSAGLPVYFCLYAAQPHNRHKTKPNRIALFLSCHVVVLICQHTFPSLKLYSCIRFYLILLSLSLEMVFLFLFLAYISFTSLLTPISKNNAVFMCNDKRVRQLNLLHMVYTRTNENKKVERRYPLNFVCCFSSPQLHFYTALLHSSWP